MKKIILGLSIFIFMCYTQMSYAYTLTQKDIIIVETLTKKVEKAISKKGEHIRVQVVEAIEKLANKNKSKPRIYAIYNELASNIDSNSELDELDDVLENIDDEKNTMITSFDVSPAKTHIALGEKIDVKITTIDQNKQKVEKYNEVVSVHFSTEGTPGKLYRTLNMNNGEYILENISFDTVGAYQMLVYDEKNDIFGSTKIVVGEKMIDISVKTSEGQSIYQKYLNKIYYNGILLDFVDPNSFEIIYCDERGYDCYVKDKNNVYYSLNNNINKIEGADVNTFKLLGDGKDFYAKDKNSVYFKGKKVEGADTNTFELIGYFVGKDNKNVYLNGVKNTLVDFQTFEKIHKNMLSGGEYKDKNNNYEIIYGVLTIIKK